MGSNVLNVLLLVGFLSPLHVGMAQKTPFDLCSRIVAIQETAELGIDAALTTLGAAKDDPIGCVNRKQPQGPRNGLQISGCREISIALEGQKSVHALKLEIEDRSGTLRAFQTDVENEDGSKDTAVCFQHNVPMGNSEFADDSPRCLSNSTGLLATYITKTCPDAIDVCVDNWLVGIEGPCDEPKPAPPAPTAPPSDPPVIPPSRTLPIPGPQPPRTSGPLPQSLPEVPSVLPPPLPPQTASGTPGPPPPTTLPPTAPDTLFIPSDLPDDIALPGSGSSYGSGPGFTQPGPPPGPPPPSGGIQVDLCFRMYSTTDRVDRSTCKGFGSSLEDPMRCIEDATFFRPDVGMAYTPCADIRVNMVPGTTKGLFDVTIGGRPGRISASLHHDVTQDRPLCIFTEVQGEGVFPGEDEGGCMHPWEPVSIYVGKTCRKKGPCSYHSLLVSGGGCMAPNTLSEEELEELLEREDDLAVGFGKAGSRKRYPLPKDRKSKWIRCSKETNSEVARAGSSASGSGTVTGSIISSSTSTSASSTSKKSKRRPSKPTAQVGG